MDRETSEHMHTGRRGHQRGYEEPWFFDTVGTLLAHMVMEHSGGGATAGQAVPGASQGSCEPLWPLGDDPSGWKAGRANCAASARCSEGGAADSAGWGVGQGSCEPMRPLGDDPSGWKSCQANCSVGARHGGSGTAYSAVAGVDQCCREPMRPSGDDPSGWKSCWTGGAGDARRGTSTPAGHTGGEATDDSVDPADTRDDDADFQNLPGTTLHDGAGHSMDDITHRQGRGQGWVRDGSGLGQAWVRAGSGLGQLGWVRAGSGLGQGRVRGGLG